MDLVTLVLIAVLVLDLRLLVAARPDAAIKASALQGVVLSFLPLLAVHGTRPHAWVHPALMSAGSLGFKGILIPALLWWAVRRTGTGAAPVAGLHVTAVAGMGMIGAAFWLARYLPRPAEAPSELLVPVALATLLIGFLLLVSRRQAVMQVIGYLTLENGVFMFGQLVSAQIPIVVELGILLDLLAAVAIMAIVMFHINRVFHHVDAGSLLSLRD